VVQHTTTTATADLQTVETLLKMHLKPTHAQLFADMLMRLAGRRVEYAALVLRHFMHAEVSLLCRPPLPQYTRK